MRLIIWNCYLTEPKNSDGQTQKTVTEIKNIIKDRLQKCKINLDTFESITGTRYDDEISEILNDINQHRQKIIKLRSELNIMNDCIYQNYDVNSHIYCLHDRCYWTKVQKIWKRQITTLRLITHTLLKASKK